MTRPLAETIAVLLDALDEAQPGAPYPLELRERIAGELAALRITTQWYAGFVDERIDAATGDVLGSVDASHGNAEAYVSAGPAHRSVETFATRSQARAWVDARLRADGYVTPGSRAPRVGERVVLFREGQPDEISRGTLARIVAPEAVSPVYRVVVDVTGGLAHSHLCALEAEFGADDARPDLTTALLNHLTQENP